MYRKFILVLSLMISPAAFADTKLDGAIDAYLDEDFSQMRVIEDYAKRGDVDAQAVIGQALWYGLGVKKDRRAGLSYLKSAASQGDRVSAVQLGRIYKLGHSEAPKDLAEAAKWFVAAAKAGETITAPRELKSMPRETVIAAGGAEWAVPAPKTIPAPTPVIVAEAKPAPVVTPAPAPTPQPASPATPTNEPEFSTNEKLSMSLNDAIFGDADYGKAAPDYILRDGSRFKVLTDTELSTSGDVAASCHVVLTDYTMAQSAILEPMLDEVKAGNRARYSEVLKLSLELEKLMPFAEMASNLVKDPARNGGLSLNAANSAYAEHSYAFDLRPEDAPSVDNCQVRMASVLGDIAVSEAEGRYWNR